MPLRLVDPRKGKSPNYSVRGTYLGVEVNRSARTSDRKKAKLFLKKWEQEIERGEFSAPRVPTFADAVIGYIKAGGERRHLPPLIRKLGETPLNKITQAAVDEAAVEIFPKGTPSTRNRQVYTPISAVLKHAGVEDRIRRPAKSKGTKRVDWLWPEEAFRLLEAASELDAEFGVFLTVLLYTGMRLSEALGLEIDKVRLVDQFAYVPDTKNDDPRAVFLPPEVIAALANHPLGMDRPKERVFASFKQNNRIFNLLTASAAKAAVIIPRGVAFHLLRHTWATWMRRFGGLDTAGLVATGAWRDRESASRYEHLVVSEEARKAALLPTPPKRKAV